MMMSNLHYFSWKSRNQRTPCVMTTATTRATREFISSDYFCWAFFCLSSNYLLLTSSYPSKTIFKILGDISNQLLFHDVIVIIYEFSNQFSSLGGVSHPFISRFQFLTTNYKFVDIITCSRIFVKLKTLKFISLVIYDHP